MNQTSQGFVEQVPILKGIRQGNSLGPILFNSIMDKIIIHVKNVSRGYRMGQR